MTNYSADILALSPYAYWKFDETTGTTAVDTANGHDGTFTQPGLNMNQTGGVPNSSGKSFLFAGSSAETITASSVSVSSAAYTVMALVKLNATPPTTYHCTLIAMDQDATQRMRIYARRNATNNRFSYWDNTNTHKESTATVTLNTWVHLAVVVNGTSLKFFVNGTASGTGTLTAPADTYTTIYLGGSTSTDPMKGNIDEVALWTSALSDATVASLASSWTNNTAAPTANAGTDITNAEPFTPITLSGSASGGSSPYTYAWSVQSGGGTVTGTTATPTYTPSGTIAGHTATIGLVVTDNASASSSMDTMTVTVLPVTERAAIGGVLVPINQQAPTS